MLVPPLQILFPLNASAFTLSPSLLLVLLRFMSALRIGFSGFHSESRQLTHMFYYPYFYCHDYNTNYIWSLNSDNFNLLCGHTISIHLKSCISKVNVIFHWRCRNVIQPVNQACRGRGECVASDNSRSATRHDYDLLPASWVVYSRIINAIASNPRIVVLNNSFAFTLIQRDE